MKNVAIYTHAGSSLTEDLKERLEAIGCDVKIIRGREEARNKRFHGFDTVFFFPCGCCPDSFAVLSDATGCFGKRVVVVANTSSHPILLNGVIENPTPEQLIRAAKKLHRIKK